MGTPEKAVADVLMGDKTDRELIRELQNASCQHEYEIRALRKDVEKLLEALDRMNNLLEDVARRVYAKKIR